MYICINIIYSKYTVHTKTCIFTHTYVNVAGHNVHLYIIDLTSCCHAARAGPQWTAVGRMQTEGSPPLDQLSAGVYVGSYFLSFSSLI